MSIAKGTILFLILIIFSKQKTVAQNIDSVFNTLKIKDFGIAGVAFYDLEKQSPLFEYQADKRFVPASNIKLLTFYAAMKLLPAQLPAYKYQEKGDSLLLWGVGNPSFLSDHFPLKNDSAYLFLKNTNKKIILCYKRYQGNAFGKGWMWDDYMDEYQPEINEFPIMGNLLTITWKGNQLIQKPCLSEAHFHSYNGGFKRSTHENEFYLPFVDSIEVKKTPYITNRQSVIAILQDTLNKKVSFDDRPITIDAKTMYSSISRDTLLKFMMQESDNFTAEELHLMICDALGLTMSTENSIDYIMKQELSDLPDLPSWVDGSGLSRYNLISPRDLILVLKKNYQLFEDKELLFQLFSVGGTNGTLKKVFKSQDQQPYVFAKTGSLTGIFCLSGYLKTQSGKNIAFSMMSNNHIVKASQVRAEMEPLINYLYKNY